MILSGIRQKVFLDRYSLKDKAGEPLEQTPEEMWRRVAKGIAKAEKPKNQKHWEDKFYKAMEDFKVVPGGRILAGAGTDFDVTFYNCFVLPSPKDSRDGILDNLKSMIEIMARGGGAGINLSSLRPKGARVKKVNGFSSGPCNWAELYSVATHDIIQQGGSRRGALMLMLWDWHPDIEEFITVKQDLSKITGANLSVCVSDGFMEAVKNDADWDLVFPDIKDPEYDEKWDGIISNWKAMKKKVVVLKTVKARYLWDLICEAAWKSAEPGIVFMERYNKMYNNWYWNKVNCTNPCGEEGLPAWGVCNLASLNLSAFVKGYSVKNSGEMDYKSLAEHARTMARLQDNIIDLDKYIFPEIREIQVEGERRIGVGTMGLGDALIKMHIRYGSDESVKVIEKIYKTIRDAAYDESADLAKEKGAFKKFDADKYLKGQFIKQLPKELRAKIKEQGIRNSLLLQAAPTGSTSLLSGVSSGIEPIYEFEFTRKDRLGEHKIYHHLYEEWQNAHPGEKRPDHFVSANDLTPQDHVKVQATIQKYLDASISKTVNAPKAHTVEDVKNLYMLAYDLGCKGITYMREGSREGVLSRTEEKKEEEKPLVIQPIRPRPYVVQGVTYGTDTPVGKTYLTINQDDQNEPFEVFITVGKSGSDVAAMADALGRMISLNLRLNTQLGPRDRIKQIVAQLIGIGGAKSVGFGDKRVRSLPDAVAKILSTHYSFAVNGVVEDKKPTNSLNGHANGHLKPHSPEGVIKVEQLSLAEVDDKVHLTTEPSTGLFDICPDCGAGSLAYEEGCRKCYSCGYSEC
ncbi:adenosylcobalamin-dependent ribonucleoside-diphosphate reductase [Patescibacteria group bacterium]|nr:adenosylcobalamin-dependent ribonucleoside-diphosphate reductase [Patescibacteria group bacterium]